MKKWNTLLCYLVFGIALFGCQKNNAGNNTEAKVDPKQESKRIIIMGIDDTGSYKLWGQAKNIASRIIMQLTPGDIFYFRRIAGKSYSDECTVFRLELPEMKKAGSHNPFDPRAKKLRKMLGLRIAALKRGAIQRIENLKPLGAKRTDIFGFLAVATEKISLTGKNVKPVVVIASDLQDNVCWRPDLDLSRAWVAIVCYQTLKNPKKAQKFKKRWSDLLSKAGAAHIRFFRTEEKFDLNSTKE